MLNHGTADNPDGHETYHLKDTYRGPEYVLNREVEYRNVPTNSRKLCFVDSSGNKCDSIEEMNTNEAEKIKREEKEKRKHEKTMKNYMGKSLHLRPLVEC